MNEKFFELPEEKRLRIINAGFEVFSQSAYKKASTEDIAATAGISKGLLFYYFHNKKALYMFLLDHAKQLLADNVTDSHFFQITDVFELIEYAALRKYQLLQKNPHILDYLMRVVGASQEAVTEDINRLWQDTTNEMFTTYFKSVDYSKFRNDVEPMEVIRMLLWTAEGYMFDMQKFGSSLELDDLTEKFRSWSAFFKKASYKEEYLA